MKSEFFIRQLQQRFEFPATGRTSPLTRQLGQRPLHHTHWMYRLAAADGRERRLSATHGAIAGAQQMLETDRRSLGVYRARYVLRAIFVETYCIPSRSYRRLFTTWWIVRVLRDREATALDCGQDVELSAHLLEPTKVQKSVGNVFG
jgi:hypothetical protein